LSSHNGMKPSAVGEKYRQLEAEQHINEKPAADVETDAHNVAPTSGLSLEDDGGLSQPQRSCDYDISKSSHSARSDHDVESVSSADGQHSTSSRRSASGASRAGSGSSNTAPAARNSHSEKADSVSSRSGSIYDNVSSKAHGADDNRPGTADSISANLDADHREVSGSIGGRKSRSGSRASSSIHSSISTETFTVDSGGSGKVRQGDADNVTRHTGSEEPRRRGDVGADTDDDVADLEPDQSLTTKPTVMARGIVDEMSAEPSISPVETRAGQEVGLDEKVTSLKDEQIPEELDSDSDYAEDGRGLGRVIRDAVDLNRDMPDPMSDTSESKTGRNSDDLHRIIRRVAAAVESFVTEDEHVKIGDGVEDHLSDGHSEKVADDATRNLLNDAIDRMLVVRRNKIVAAAAEASKASTAPATVPLSPSVLSEGAKSTASNSSDGQVCS